MPARTSSAIGDLFDDRAAAGKKRFDEALAKKNLPPIDPSQIFRGPNAVSAFSNPNKSTPSTSPRRLTSIPSTSRRPWPPGKHVYVEKPVAVDVPGAKRVMRAGQKASGKLSLAVGFQIRQATPYRGTRQARAPGRSVRPSAASRITTPALITRPEWPGVSPATRRLRNWVHDRVLSGDIIVEQNIHIIDVINWMLQGHPLKAMGTGGRRAASRGDCWGHFNCQYTYPGDVHVNLARPSSARDPATWPCSISARGATSKSHYDSPLGITGEEAWEFPGQTKAGQITDAKAAATGAFRGASRRGRPQEAARLHLQHHQRQPARRGRPAPIPRSARCSAATPPTPAVK